MTRCVAIIIFVLHFAVSQVFGFVSNIRQKKIDSKNGYSNYHDDMKQCFRSEGRNAIGFLGNRNYKLFAARRSTASLFNQETKKTARVKKNKYSNFSRTDKSSKDPFEALVEESEEKLRKLEEEKKPRHDVVPIEVDDDLEFPNNRDIDPYDPTTFGYIEIGTILGAHGVHGWVKVQGCTDFPERLTRPGMPLHVKPYNKRAPRKITLVNGKMTGKDSFLIQLQGKYDRDEAKKLKGATIYYATQQDTVVDKEGEVRVSELAGLNVFLPDEQFVGIVQGVLLGSEMCAIPGLGQDMLEVALDRKEIKPGAPKELVLVPLVPELVPIVDLSENVIIIDPPTGLLDLKYIREEKVRIKGLLPPARD